MTYFGQYHESHARDYPRHSLGVIALDDLIVLPVRNSGRYLHSGQILLCEVWLPPPHDAKTIYQLWPSLRMRREQCVLGLAAAAIACKDAASGTVCFLSIHGAICDEGQQSRYPIGFSHCQLKSSDGAVTPTDDGDFGYLQKVQQVYYVFGKQVVAEGGRRHWAPPVAARIHDSYRENLRE